MIPKAHTLIDFTLYDYAVVGSTNDEAKVLLAQGAGEGTVIRAERQTAGRGRRGGNWISEVGNLYCSIILTPECTLSEANQLSFVMAIAVGEAVLPMLLIPHTLTYKWPNDLLLEGKKVAGILIETESQGEQFVKSCVIGIGLNIHVVPEHSKYQVTALIDHVKSSIDKEALFVALLDNVKTYYEIWRQKGFQTIRKVWLERAHGLGQKMQVVIGEKETHAEFMDLSPEGALVLKNDDGTSLKLMSAEIL
ncbi:MAG: biotin--[acetyl-CoA-carboxylase] ligase [Alphaproteobacteria bacterium]|nr:biotin--[acetyl-CoA-carboxylase] ligase [Alphaproteobacteria bacterium]